MGGAQVGCRVLKQEVTLIVFKCGTSQIDSATHSERQTIENYTPKDTRMNHTLDILEICFVFYIM